MERLIRSREPVNWEDETIFEEDAAQGVIGNQIDID